MKWAKRAVLALSVAYAVFLVIVVLLLRFVGEDWWVTSVTLYLPRVGFGAPLPFIAGGLAALGLRRWLATQAFAALVLIFPLMGFVLPVPRFADSDQPKIRVLSYNANSGNGGIDRLADEINRFSPDVVMLQEMYDNDQLVAKMRDRLPHSANPGQFAVVSRFPVISKFDPQKLAAETDTFSPRYFEVLLDTPLGPIAFYDLHTLSPRNALHDLRGGGVRREVLSGHIFDGGSAASIQEQGAHREHEVAMLVERARTQTIPVVIGGDTNLPELSTTLHRQLSTYQDGFREAGWGFGYTYPVNRFRWMRIDRVLASRELRFTHFEVGRSDASDHACVVADLQRREP